jgi:hypothetical protein
MLQFPVERSLNKISVPSTGSIQIPFGIRLKLPEIEYVLSVPASCETYFSSRLQGRTVDIAKTQMFVSAS